MDNGWLVEGYQLLMVADIGEWQMMNTTASNKQATKPSYYSWLLRMFSHGSLLLM